MKFFTKILKKTGKNYFLKRFFERKSREYQ